VSEHRTGRHAEHGGTHGLEHRGQHARQRVAVDVEVGRWRLVEGGRQRLEQVAVGRGAALHPLAAVDGDDRDAMASGGDVEAGRIGYPQLGHPGQLLELHAHHRVDVALRTALGGDGRGDLAGDVPAGAARLAGHHAEHVAERSELAERVVVTAEGVEWTVAGHGGIVGPCPR